MSGGGVRSMRAWRRTAIVGVGVGTAVLTTAFTGLGTTAAQTAPADDDFSNGRGAATASGLRVDPRLGNLSFGVGVGESLAGYQNTVGTAESRTANLGVIGVTLAAEGCDGGDPTLPSEQQPQALRIDSSQEGAVQGISREDHVVGAIQRFVRATPEPFAESIVEAPGIEIPGLLSVGPIISRTTSGVVNGEYRESIATVEVGKITILNLITLTGLRWEAIHRSGAVEEASGSFTIAHATGPLNIPLPVNDVLALLGSLNGILQPLGLEIRLPTFHVDTNAAGSLATVDPFGVALIPAPLRDGVIGELITQLQPLRQQLTNALIEADCGNATYVTLLDVALAGISKGGEIGILIGGAQATTAPISLFDPGERPTRPPTTTPTTAGGSRTTPTTPRTTPTIPRTTPTTAPVTTAPPAEEDEEEDIDDAVETSGVDGERGGPLLAVGAGGLLLLLATAEGDRRKMRRAQREIPLEG